VRLAWICYLFLLGACASERPKAHLIEAIESRVAMPPGSRPIDEYSRHYANLPDGRVIGIYVVPPTPIATDAGCDVVGPIDDGGSLKERPCSSSETADLKNLNPKTAEAFGKAGEWRWWQDYKGMPGINDGGCDQVNVIYDPRTDRIDPAVCNGRV
jgi:hypothetical protein